MVGALLGVVCVKNRYDVEVRSSRSPCGEVEEVCREPCQLAEQSVHLAFQLPVRLLGAGAGGGDIHTRPYDFGGGETAFSRSDIEDFFNFLREPTGGYIISEVQFRIHPHSEPVGSQHRPFVQLGSRAVNRSG